MEMCEQSLAPEFEGGRKNWVQNFRLNCRPPSDPVKRGVSPFYFKIFL